VWMLKAYLAMPWAWLPFGKQFLIVARKNTSCSGRDHCNVEFARTRGFTSIASTSTGCFYNSLLSRSVFATPGRCTRVLAFRPLLRFQPSRIS
jgi:hypothetical protein